MSGTYTFWIDSTKKEEQLIKEVIYGNGVLNDLYGCTLMLPRVLAIGLISLMMLSGCTTHEQIRVAETEDVDISSLALVVPNTGTFEIEYSRLSQDGTSTVLFGLIGYAIEAGYRDAIDSDMEKSMEEFVASLNCPAELSSAIQIAFAEESDIIVDVYSDKKQVTGNYDAIAEFKMEHCGYTATDRDSDMLVAFITVSAKVTSANGRVIWNDKESFRGNESSRFARMLEQEGMARGMLNRLLKDAGARLAYNIIYQ